MKWREAGEDCIMRNFVTCTLRLILLRVNKSWTIRWARLVVLTEAMRSTCNISVGIPVRKRPLGMRIVEWILGK
jgi:hypothetical protein